MKSEGTDYVFIESALEPDRTLVGLRTGIYAGVIYSYSTVKLVEEGETCRLKFTFSLEKWPVKFTKEELEVSPQFAKEMGDVLAAIMSSTPAIGKLPKNDGRTKSA